MKRCLLTFLMLAGIEFAFSQQFRINLQVTDGASSQRLTFGVNPAGTGGFDPALDTLAPPPGPAGVFDARLRYPASVAPQDYFVDIRSNAPSPDTFYVHYAAGSGPVVTVTWDTLQLDQLASSFTITDNINGSLFTMNMKSRQRIRSDTASGLVTTSFRLIITPPYLPVQLVSFTGSVINQQGHIRLNWRTLTETNNYGFFVQKSLNGQLESYQTISELIPGHGTTLEPHDYTWTDMNPVAGNWYYRLKQVDLDGSTHYTEGILPSGATGVKEKTLPSEFGLNQNYPNPFNPTTNIEYALPRQSSVKIEVYNLIGQRMATLLDAVKPAGVHFVKFDANGFSSGLYFYRMTADGNVNLMKKMVLMR